MDYNKTLNLPKTEFPMRASLPQREPEFLKGWEKRKLYNQLMEHNEGKPLFVLHDGPPYANGSIHIGHALNKTLKDFIVRYKNMTGFKSPYVPGWDTHGLPTELAARKKAGITAESNISDLELRKICRDTALGFVDIQREGFKRLGVMAEWDHPYITLQKEFEQEQIKVFAQMASKGYIYKGLKPVYWCPDCKTALAEAEIEYAEDPCHSIYVKFKVTDDMGKLTALGAELDKTYFVIWTTTTWTLPANVAICVGPNYEYSVLKANGEYYVMATDLAPEAMADAGITDYETVGIIKGSELEYMKTAHPFIDRTSLVIVGDHVTLESGTGCVHTAPGHGVDDFVVCRKYPEIPIVVPVDENGVLTGKGLSFGGSLIRPEATGFGAVYYLCEVLKHENDTIEGKTVAVSGFGNVAWGVTKKVAELGGKVVTLSGPDGYIYDPDGVVTEEKINYMLEMNASRRNRVQDYADKFGVEFFPGEKPFGRKVDIVMPCAMQNDVHMESAEKIVANGIKYYIEVANMPTTNDALYFMMDQPGMIVAPSKAVNAGGVAVSGLEMSQNAERLAWTAEEVDAKLRHIMVNIHKASMEAAEECGLGYNLVAGANIAGFKKVADAMMAQGIC